MAELIISASTDFSAASIPLDTTALRFTNVSGTIVGTFGAGQFDGSPIATSVRIIGNTFGNKLIINGDAGIATVLDASAWQFTDFGGVGDTITINGGAGHDELIGSSVADTTSGLDGDDILKGGRGGDRLYGGLGADTVVYELPNEVEAGERVDGGAGLDRIFISRGSPSSFDFRTATIANVEKLEFVDPVGVIYETPIDILLNSNQISGGTGKINTLTGSVSSFLLENVHVYGASINLSAVTFESWDYYNSKTILHGTSTSDSIIGSLLSDIVYTNGGIDVVRTGLGNDQIILQNMELLASGAVLDGGPNQDRLTLDISGNPSLDLRIPSVFGIEELEFKKGATVILQPNFIGSFFLVFGSDSIDQIETTGNIVNWGGIGFYDWNNVEDKIKISGTNISDRLFGSAARDEIFGHDGDDIIEGRSGNNSLYGGDGNDRFIFRHTRDTSPNAFIDGGNGNEDTIVLDSHNIFIRTGEFDFSSITVSSIEKLELYFLISVKFLDAQLGGLSGISRISVGPTFDFDIIVQGDQIDISNVVIGGWNVRNRLTFIGTTNADSMTGGLFSEFMKCNAGNDVAFGNGGNDVIWGGNDNDTLDGGIEEDRLYGERGDDVLYGQAGRDISRGGIGNDRIYGGDESGLGDYSLAGEDGNDLVEGGAGIDRIDGGDGADQLFGGIGNDNITGGSANDQLDGGAGKDLMRGQAGADTLRGGADNDVLFGNEDGDNLSGEAGSDFLEGGAGDDTLLGGAGRDTFNFEAATGTDSVLDFEDNLDTLRIDANYGFADAAAVVAATISSAGNARIILGGGNQIFLMSYIANGNTVASLIDDIAIA